MTTRFDVERAVLASDLPSTDRLLMLVLLTHADADPVVIPTRFTPSLNGLAEESDLDRSTVKRGLRRLDDAGWIVREPPPPAEARKGTRTRYRLAVPVGAQDAYPVGAQSAQGGRTQRPGVGAQSAQGGRTERLMSKQPSSTNHSNPRARNGSRAMETTVALVAERLTAETGRTYDPRDVADSVRAFLRGRTVSNPSAYVRKCADENPLQFEPTPSPPRYQREDHQ